MKKFCLALLLAGLLGGTSAHAANLVTQNAGFDGQVPFNENVTDVIDGTNFAPWRAYSISGHTSQFAVKAEATAPSAPNVFEFSTTGGAWLNEVLDLYPNEPLNLVGGHVYKVSFWARAMDATDHMYTVMGFYNADGAFSGLGQVQTLHWLTANWQRFEVEFVLPAGTAGVDPQFGCDTDTWDIQLDSIAMEDVTYTDANRQLNGGFEDSTTAIPGWAAGSVGGNDLAATLITSDFAEGKQAVKLAQNNTPGGSDGAFNSGFLPWNGADQMTLTFKLKDLTAISAADNVEVLVAPFDDATNFLGVNAGLKIVKPDSGSWTTVTDVVNDLPAGTTKYFISFRITDGSGATIPGDLMIDDVTVVDSTLGAPPAPTPTPTPLPDVSQTMNAVKKTITVDGSAADWDLTASQAIHMVNPSTDASVAGHLMTVDMRYSWDNTYLYLLIQESGDSQISDKEAASGADFAAGPWLFDCMSPWINLNPTVQTPTKSGFNPWLGFSSTGQTDLVCARVNATIETSGAAMNDAVLAGSKVATSGTQAAHNRVVEARFSWAAIAGAVNPDRLPAGGLLAAVKAGLKIGVDPLMVQGDYHGQCFMNGVVGAPPTGRDASSRYILLTDAVPVELSGFSVE